MFKILRENILIKTFNMVPVSSAEEKKASVSWHYVVLQIKVSSKIIY